MTENDLIARLTRLAVYAADLQCWYRLPWYQRLTTPKPKEPTA